MVALDDLAATFQLTVREESLGAITVSYKGKTIVLTPDQPLASVSGRLVSLPAPPARSGSRWLVPVEFISRALALIYDTRLDLRKPSRLLVIGDLRVPRITVRYDPLGASGRLTIDATPRALASDAGGRPPHDQVRRRRARRAEPAAAGAGAAGPPPGDPRPRCDDAGRRSRSALRGIQGDEPAGRHDHAAGDRSAGGPDDGRPRRRPRRRRRSRRPPDLPPSFGQPTSAIHTIAIDPGHGGEDDRRQGRRRGERKGRDARRRAARERRDRSAARPPRPADARRRPERGDRRAHRDRQQQQGRPVHQPARQRVDAHGDRRRRRSSTPRSSGTPRRMRPPAASTACPTFGGGARDIELVLWDLAQTRHLDQSAAFAGLLEQQLRDRVPLAAPAVDRAALRVLESANMPAVLIEMGYLTNPDQEKLLATDAFQTTFVQAMYDAVVQVPRHARGRRDPVTARPQAAPSAPRSSPPPCWCSRCSSAAALDHARDDDGDRGRGRAAPSRQRPPGRKIKARLFYVAEDGTQADERRARRAVRRGPDRAGARDHRRADRAGRRAARVRGAAGHDAARASSSPKAARPSWICSRERRVGASRRHAQRAADGLHARERADREPARRHRRSSCWSTARRSRRCRPHRSPPAAREESQRGSNQTELTRCDPTSDRRISCARRPSRRTT